MYEWLDHRTRRHAEELRAEAKRHHLARALRNAERNESRARWRTAHRLAEPILELARGTLAGPRGVLEQPAPCEECLSE